MKHTDFAFIPCGFILDVVVMFLSDSGVIFGLEPFDGVGLLDPMGRTNGGGASLTAGNTLTWAGPITHTKLDNYVLGELLNGVTHMMQ